MLNFAAQEVLKSVAKQIAKYVMNEYMAKETGLSLGELRSLSEGDLLAIARSKVVKRARAETARQLGITRKQLDALNRNFRSSAKMKQQVSGRQYTKNAQQVTGKKYKPPSDQQTDTPNARIIRLVQDTLHETSQDLTFSKEFMAGVESYDYDYLESIQYEIEHDLDYNPELENSGWVVLDSDNKYIGQEGKNGRAISYENFMSNIESRIMNGYGMEEYEDDLY